MPPRASTSPLLADRPAGGAHLRLLAPPSQFRPGQLPLTVRPLPGELAVSWLTRAAHRFGVTPRALLQATGVIHQTASTTAALRRVLAPARLQLLGLSAADAAELGAPHPTADAFRRQLTLYQRPSARIELKGPRYCPACLASDAPYWPKSWQLSTTLVCVDHRLVLVEVCPRCGRAPFSGPDWLATTTAVHQCPRALLDDDRPGRRVRRRCTSDLRTASAEAASGDDVAAQRLLDAAGPDPQVLASTCGIQVEVVILFGAVLDLTDALVTQGVPERAARTRVVTALGCTSPSAAAAHLGLFDRPAAPAGIPNPLAEALRLETSRPHHSATRQLELRAARTFLARPLRDGHRQRPAHVLPEHRTPRPTLHDLRDAALPTVTDADGTPLPTEIVRLLTARLGRPGSWADLARALGIPSDAAFTMSATLRSLQRQGTWAACIHVLETWIQELSREQLPIRGGSLSAAATSSS